MTRGCAGCHGATGVEGPAPRLVGPPRADHYPASTGAYPGSTWPGRGISNFPFEPLIWSFINKAMPLKQRGYLNPDELYSVTAYLLHLNGIIGETDVMDAATLPQVHSAESKRVCASSLLGVEAGDATGGGEITSAGMSKRRPQGRRARQQLTMALGSRFMSRPLGHRQDRQRRHGSGVSTHTTVRELFN